MARETEMTWVEPQLIESAWALLPGGPVAEDPESGECWQYMGSERNVYTDEYTHSFRHRCYPRTGVRRYVQVVERQHWGTGDSSFHLA